jgi:hypothetical protein
LDGVPSIFPVPVAPCHCFFVASTYMSLERAKTLQLFQIFFESMPYPRLSSRFGHVFALYLHDAGNTQNLTTLSNVFCEGMEETVLQDLRIRTRGPALGGKRHFLPGNPQFLAEGGRSRGETKIPNRERAIPARFFLISVRKIAFPDPLSTKADQETTFPAQIRRKPRRKGQCLSGFYENLTGKSDFQDGFYRNPLGKYIFLVSFE